jgi:hypothetical protein
MKRSEGTFTVVNPQTDAFHLTRGEDSEDERRQSREFLRKELAVPDYDVRPLVDQLLARNARPHRLSLKSDPARGYVVDDEGKYDKYFEKDGGGWERWYKENPNAHGMTGVSLPAHDAKAGYLLIYVGTQAHWLNGAGHVILYRVTDGKLKRVKQLMLWIS